MIILLKDLINLLKKRRIFTKMMNPSRVKQPVMAFLIAKKYKLWQYIDDLQVQGVIALETDINKRVNEFFKKYQLNEITPENVKKHFKNIKETNNYGGLLHAAVQNKFEENKVVKFIEVLLECGVDANLKGKDTGYSFIHLALYGYTDNEKDYSYTTEFILKLISIAKNYNFDVNIKDNDGDSII